MSHEIRKVAFDGKTVDVEFRETRGADGADELTTRFRCPDEPHPDFIEALNALRSHVSEICGFCPCWHDAMQVTTVSLSGSCEPSHLSASITIHKSIPGAAGHLVVTTPRIAERPSCETDAALPEGCGDAIRALISEAEGYMKGKRAQGGLFEEKTGKSGRGRKKSGKAA